MTRNAPANYINHFAINLDKSYSMKVHASALIQAMDNYVRFLAQLSQEQDQETRLTVYTFSSYGQETCLFYDKDVLRMPSIAGLYHPSGNTALIDCAMKSIDELEQTATLYGEHAFMATMLSDGQENDSQRHGSRYEAPKRLAARIAGLPENWTTTAFGPNNYAVVELKKCGFPADNIAVWDTTSSKGIEQVGEMMRTASVAFMEGRKQGIHGYNKGAGSASGGMFRMREFSAAEVKSTAIAMTDGSFFFLDVPAKERIDEFVSRETKKPYTLGRCYYQFMKTETIQGQKELAVELDGKVYTGRAARGVLGLPDHSVRVRPDQKAGCTIFVQSTSYNRNLVPGTRLLVLR